jgi:predicted permease
MSALDLSEIVKSVALSMTAIIVYAVGGWLCGRFNLLAPHTDGTLGRVVFLLALPALLFLEVSEQKTFTALLLVATAVTVLVGMVVGGVACRRAPISMRRTIMMSIAIPNMASIPLALVSRLFGTSDAGILQSLTGATDALASVSITLVVLEAIVWGFLFSFLAKNDPLSGLVAAPPRFIAQGDELGFATCSSEEDDVALPTVVNSNPENSNSIVSNNNSGGSTPAAAAVRLESGRSVPPTVVAAVSWRSRLTNIWRRSKPTLARVFNPPFVAVVLALIVANTPARDWFHSDDKTAPLEPAPLAFVVAILRMMANCTVPLLLLVVGLSFAKLQSLVPARDDSLDWVSLALVCVCRLLIVPAIMLGLMEPARSLLNPSERIVLLLQSCTPINIDVLIIAQLVKNNVKETTILMFWTYFLGIFTMTGWLIAFIVLHSES